MNALQGSRNEPSPKWQTTNEESLKRTKTAYLLAFTLLSFPFIIFLLCTVFLWFGVPISIWQAPLALAATVALSQGFQKYTKSETTRSAVALVLFVVVGAGGLLASFFYDFSGDGQAYHQPSIMALTSGWNPFHQYFIADWNRDFAHSITTALFVDHYAKASWITASAIYKFTHVLESAKIFNFIYLAATFLIAFGFLSRFNRIPARVQIVASLFIACNPVTVYQLASFYVDGQLASLVTIAIIICLDSLLFRQRHLLALLAVSLPLLVNVKFTGLVYAVMIVGLTCIILWYQNDRRSCRSLATMAGLCIMFSVVILGYQPYMTNLINHRNPFYPAIGYQNGQNIISEQAPLDFLQKDRLSKLVLSVLAKSSDSSSLPKLKIPFVVDRTEAYPFLGTDARYGGFGPLFGSVTLFLVLVAPVFMRNANKASTQTTLAALLLILGSALVNPEAWWARLAPQIWLLPTLLILFLYHIKTRFSKLFGGIAMALLAVNLGFVTFFNNERNLTRSMDFRGQMVRLQEVSTHGGLEVQFTPAFFLAQKHRLESYGIRYMRSDTLRCASPILVSYPISAPMKVCMKDMH